MKRILIAGILGGLVMFIWGALTHMVLPIGEMGIQSLPGEENIVPVLQREIQQPGFYFFPGMDMSGQATAEQQQAWEAKYAAGPVGVIVYQTVGGTPLSARRLLTELTSNILAAFILAWVLTLVGVALLRGVIIAGLFGLFAWLSISVSYWNWFGFPSSLTAGEFLDQVIGWMLAGIVVTMIVRRKRASSE